MTLPRRAALTVLTVALLLLGAPPAGARVAVDPGTLSPVPPAGASCWRTSPGHVLCNTFVFIESDGEPVVDLSCGTVYVSGPDHRLGTRWYEGGTLVRRLVRQDSEQTLSLTPDMSGPTLRVQQHDSWWGVSDDALVFHGNGLLVTGPGFGVVAHMAGLDELDGTHHGTFSWLEDADVAPRVCAALA